MKQASQWQTAQQGNWQQWQEWQTQYAQWQAQYGEKVSNSILVNLFILLPTKINLWL